MDYVHWADYIESIFKKYRREPSLLLDLGCGTGKFTVEMAKRGYEMIGLDISADMLDCARERAESEGREILFLHQDMTSFELYGTVDAVLCMLDGVNYITRKNDLTRLFKLVKNYLNPQGLFIFDVNSSYKFEHVLGNNVFYEVGDDITYIWQNRYHPRKRLCEFDLTFFIKEGDGYRKYEETHVERNYSQNEILEGLRAAGMDPLGMFASHTFKKPGRLCERIFYICSK